MTVEPESLLLRMIESILQEIYSLSPEDLQTLERKEKKRSKEIGSEQQISKENSILLLQLQ